MQSTQINVKFLMVYHKPDIMFNNDMIVPIHAGRALLRLKAAYDSDARTKLEYMEKTMIGDDTGDNISLKNASYNELTAIYWAWMNYDKIGNPTHIGLMHYRRHFIFKDLDNTFNECDYAGPDYFSNKLNFNKDIVNQILATHDFIAKKAAKCNRAFDVYSANHRPENLLPAIEVLKEKFPEYTNACDKYFNGHDLYYLNMFVFPKQLFFQYCEFIFGILGELEKRIDTSRMRFFISEFLTGIFIQYLIDNGYNGAFYPTMYLEETAVVPVVYAVSINSIRSTCVSISSLLRNLKQSTQLQLFAFCPADEQDIISSQINTVVKKYSNCKFTIVPCHLENGATEEKLLAFAILNQKSTKAIFMANNTICKGDITPFFRTSVDDYAIAGARSPYVVAGSKIDDMELVEIGLKDTKHYIDCGVMLINLQRLRLFELDTLIKNAYAKTKLTLEEVINAVCYDQIRMMPLRLAFSTEYYENVNGVMVPKVTLDTNYSQQDMLHANKTALIVKFDRGKPWLDSECFRAQDWFYHEQLSGIDDDLINGKVSIVMPAYNAEKYIAETINSLLNQSYKNFEILCIDDGSTDSTAAIISNFKKRDKRVKLIKQKNSGAAEARNKGLSLADGQYVMILDADDIYHSDMIRKLVQKAHDTDAEIVFCRSVGFNTQDNTKVDMPWSLLVDKISCNPFKYHNLGAYLYMFTKGWPWDKLYSTRLIRRAQVKFQNLQNTNDAYFVFTLLTRARLMAYVDEVLVSHRRNNNESISNNRTRNWFCFYAAIKAIKDNLIICNVYHKVERAFSNWVLNFVLWYVRTMPYPLRNYLYIVLKEAIFDEFGINGHESSYVVNKEDYELYLTVNSIPVPKEAKQVVNDFYLQGNKFDASRLSDYVCLDLAGMEIKKAHRKGFERRIVPVVLSCNNEYVKYTAVAIQSIIDHLSYDEKCEIYVLHSGLKSDNITRLENIKGANYAVKCIDVGKYMPPQEELYTNEHITIETYFRFYIPKVINHPKVIYIDCDTIVMDDIGKLLDIETKGAPISGVCNFMNKTMYYYVKNILHINPDFYINGGVLVIDTKKCQSIGLLEAFLKLVQRNYRFLDQDIINIACKDKITLLPDRWNYQWHNHNEGKKLASRQQEYDLAAHNPAIIHFTTSHKAWNTPNWQFAQLFWYYAAKTNFFNEILSSNRDAIKDAKYDVRNVESSTISDVSSASDAIRIKAIYDDEIETINSELIKCREAISGLKNSYSYKIGRFITWIPRKIKATMRCYRENGLAFTLVRIFKGKKGAAAYRIKRSQRKLT